MDLKPWKVLDTKSLRKHVRVDTCETASGAILDALVLEYGDWTNLLALTEDKQVVLVRQYRHGIRDITWELPGGMVEQGEAPINGAKRELLEETGYEAEQVIEIGKAYANPASHNNAHYSFLALKVKRLGDQNLDDTEDILVSLLPLETVIEMAKRGELANPMQVTTLFYALAYMKCI